MEQHNNLDNDLDAIEKLAELRKKGILTEAEFLEKKNAVLNKNADGSNNKSHVKDSDQEDKLVKKIKNAGSSSEAVGWLEIIIIAVIFGLKYFANVSINFGFFGNAVLLVASFLAIVLGRRIKNVNDKKIKNYLITLLVTFIISFALVIVDGGRIGLIGIIIVIYLIQAIRAVNKLESLGLYEKKFDEKKHSINKIGWVLFAIISILLIVFGLFVDAQSYNSQTAANNGIVNTNSNSSSNNWQLFNSVDEGFKINFPNYPKKEVTPASQTNGVTIRSTTYTSNEGSNDTYLVAVYGYDIKPSNYNVKNGLEGMINGFVNNISGASLTSSSLTNFGNYQAIDFVVSVPKENMTFKGKAIIRDDLPTIKAYMILSGSTANTITKHDQFVSSFAFTN